MGREGLRREQGRRRPGHRQRARPDGQAGGVGRRRPRSATRTSTSRWRSRLPYERRTTPRRARRSSRLARPKPTSPRSSSRRGRRRRLTWSSTVSTRRRPRQGALDLGTRIAEAAAQASAGNQARIRTEQYGDQLMADAINAGQGYPARRWLLPARRGSPATRRPTPAWRRRRLAPRRWARRVVAGAGQPGHRPVGADTQRRLPEPAGAVQGRPIFILGLGHGGWPGRQLPADCSPRRGAPSQTIPR